MKKKIILVSAIAACLALIVGMGTFAYFTDEDRAHNIISTGAVAVCIEEWTLQDGELIPYPKTAVEVMPGAEVSKIVTVKNSDETALVRVSYDIEVMDADGNLMLLSDEELEKCIIITPDTENWSVKAEFDGWYYYNAPLSTGDVTLPLFEKVEFSGTEMGKKFEGSTFKVNVHAQAVQATNNAASAIDAAGWPQE